jgi:hypothetical protein
MPNPSWDVGMVCINGHRINRSSEDYPEYNSAFCRECGGAAVTSCSSCNSKIRGYLRNTGVVDLTEWKIPAYCHACGKPYPWTESRIESLTEAIEDAERLSPEEKETLKLSIPDILSQTPKSDNAVARFKRAIAKSGQASGKLIYDVAVKVATEAIAASIR